MQIQFIHQGDPISQKRHRHCRVGSAQWDYDPQAKLKNDIRLTMISDLQSKSWKVDDSPIQIQFIFCFSPPSSKPIKEANRLLWQQYHLQKPDVDNLIKFYLDCATGLYFPDDAFVTCLEKPKKKWAEIPQTIMTISKLPLAIMGASLDIVSTLKPSEIQELSTWMNELYHLSFNLCDISADALSNDKIEMMAFCLSRLADAYADKLSKIKRKHPNHWKEQATIPMGPADRAKYSNGKPCC